jgi:hypothetical protein
MIHCFISFPSVVEDDAKFIKTQLEEIYPENLVIFLATNPADIRPGQDWYDEIIKKLSDCDRLLVLIPTFDVSPWVMFETGAAMVGRKTVVPLRYYGLDPGFLPDPLAQKQSLSLGDEDHVKQLLLDLASGKAPEHERVKRYAQSIASHFRSCNFRNRVTIERQSPLLPMRERIAYLSICSHSQRDLFYFVLQKGRNRGVLESTIRNSIKIDYSHHGEDECPGLHISPSEYYYRLRELYHLGLLELKKIKAFHNRWSVPRDVQEELGRLDPTLLSGAK